MPKVAGLLALLAGLLDIVGAVRPGLRFRLHQVTDLLPGALSNTARAITLVAGLLLVLLARGLYRRKHRAWGAAVALLVVSVATHVLGGSHFAELVVGLVMLVGLLAYRREFYAVGDPNTRWGALRVFLLMVAFSLLVGLVILQVRRGQILGAPSFGDMVQHVVLGMVGVTGPLVFRHDLEGDVVSDLLLALGIATVLVTAYLLLRPATPRAGLSADDEDRMRGLLDRYGRLDSLAYFALRPDKSVMWSPTGKACVAYRVVSGVMLASGDPLGDPEAWPGAQAEFLDEADRHAWTPAVLGASETGAASWVRAGLQALELGDEAIVELADFSLDGRAMRNVRQAVGRVERAGYRADVRRLRDFTREEIVDLARQADAWRGDEVERGFSMALGRISGPRDGEGVAVLAMRRVEGQEREQLAAFLHFVPWGPDGLSLNLMRRDREADNGLNEFLIVSALRAAPDLGVRRMSLNFAVFRSALERGEKIGAGPISRAWRGLLVFAGRWFQIESLYRFNAKFRPIWEPRFVCYPSSPDLPRIAVAGLEAEAFLVLPWQRPDSWWQRRQRRRRDAVAAVTTSSGHPVGD